MRHSRDSIHCSQRATARGTNASTSRRTSRPTLSKGQHNSAILADANWAIYHRASGGRPEENAECAYRTSPTRRKGHVTVESTYRPIRIDQVDFDKENPRIKVALEKYGDKLDDKRIRFALQTATEGSSSTSSYRSLKDSIRAARGISVPIVVSPEGDRFVCVDGNTRLAIYNELAHENAPGDWITIKCLVLDNPTQNRH